MTTQAVLDGTLTSHVECADLLDYLPTLPEQSVDLVLGSPPYLDARTYGIGATYGCQEWVDWMLRVTAAAVRVSKGLVLWVAAGVQRDKCYWPGCEGLMWEWWKQGNQLWRPAVWRKADENGGGTGIPGSGGKQWLRGDWEYVMAFKREGWLPWADPLVMGHPPIYDRQGGKMSNRGVDGERANADPWDKHGRGNNLGGRKANGKAKKGTTATMDAPGGKDGSGERKENVSRPLPAIANPGNFLEFPVGVVQARVGGGHMGKRICHEGEAPYPEKLAEFFVRSFCPVDGIVLDPFMGTGTTAAMAIKWQRRALGCDIRQSQVDLARRRLGVEQVELFVE